MNELDDRIRPVDWDGDTSMIKQCTLDFYAETDMVGPCDPDWFVENTKMLCDKGLAMLSILTGDGKIMGAVAGLVGPSPFHSYPSLAELFFYIKPDYRNFSRFMLLHTALINWGRAMGAIECFVANFEKKPGPLSRIYTKHLKYIPFNQQFYGRIE